MIMIIIIIANVVVVVIVEARAKFVSSLLSGRKSELTHTRMHTHIYIRYMMRVVLFCLVTWLRIIYGLCIRYSWNNWTSDYRSCDILLLLLNLYIYIKIILFPAWYNGIDTFKWHYLEYQLCRNAVTKWGGMLQEKFSYTILLW